MKLKNATHKHLIIYAGKEQDPEPNLAIELNPKEEKEWEISEETRMVINEK